MVKTRQPEQNGNGEHEDDGSYMYWNAACTLVYLKDSHVSEMYQPETETMLFEDVVILESTDWEKYFTQLYDVIKDSIKKNANIKNVIDYIKKTDSIEDTAQKGSDEEIAQFGQKVIAAAEAANQSAAEAAGIIADQEKKNEKNIFDDNTENPKTGNSDNK